MLFVSSKSEALFNKSRLAISNLAFGNVNLGLGLATDYNKPLSVPFGADNQAGQESLDSVKRQFTSVYPQVATKIVIPEDPAKDPNFKERDIDLMRAQKDKVNKRQEVTFFTFITVLLIHVNISFANRN